MTTSALPDALSALEFQPELPCEDIRGCTAAASWAGVGHNSCGCPAFIPTGTDEIVLCGPHKEATDQSFPDLCATFPCCRGCGAPTVRTLDWTRL